MCVQIIIKVERMQARKHFAWPFVLAEVDCLSFVCSMLVALLLS